MQQSRSEAELLGQVSVWLSVASVGPSAVQSISVLVALVQFSAIAVSMEGTTLHLCFRVRNRTAMHQDNRNIHTDCALLCQKCNNGCKTRVSSNCIRILLEQAISLCALAAALGRLARLLRDFRGLRSPVLACCPLAVRKA